MKICITFIINVYECLGTNISIDMNFLLIYLIFYLKLKNF